ncbi:MAG: UDP-N-acetylmuramoyl-L-alanine--D-glutamate ligase, partial [Betaproteobacteria bacterium]|nr:UDP-N-acetylmuramoyl-L-alanine--D-glutamate ligase [Betaproteobacteria bacterium]
TREGARARVADTRAAPPRAEALRASVPQAELHTGPFAPGLLDGADLVCISPGLSLGEPVVREAQRRGIPVLGDIELFAWRVRGARAGKVAAITGTNGKTTVTALTGHLLRAAGIDCEVAGNIGPAALEALMRRLDAGRLPAVWVLELSSYQLETTWALEPDAAAMLNLSEDHLDRYAGLEDYGAAKARVFLGEGVQVLNRDDARSLALALPGRERVTFGLGIPPRPEDFGVINVQGTRWLAQGANALARVEDLPLAGWHNVANALAAAALARSLGARYAALAAGVLGFQGLPHRLQRIALRAGVAYYDDSKGTNVGATVAALRGLAQTCVLIAGGDGKGQDFAPLAQPVGELARRVLLIGRDAPRIAAALEPSGVPVERCASLEDAVARAARAAQPGDAVLLSPACASFDMFRDYRHRGEVFAAAVKALGD